MKVAIHNGWLVFDNELHPELEAASCMWGVRGRLRLSDVSSYTRWAGVVHDWGHRIEHGTVTKVWLRGSAQDWSIHGDCVELLDAYFGALQPCEVP